MAHIEEGVVALLEASTAVVDQVDDRIWPSKLQQGADMPAITYLRVSSPRVHSHHGPSGLAFARIQINCWAGTFTGARDLADAVRRRLDGWRGITAGVRIGGILLQGERDDNDEDRDIQRVILEFVVHANETTART